MESCSKRNAMPCAACKLLRRRCTEDCIFLPHFPPSEPEKFAAVHRIFGASNISKILQEIPVNDRGDAATSLVYEATVRLKEPIYGCVALISSLQKQVLQLQSQLNEAFAETLTLRTQLSTALSFIVQKNPCLLNHSNMDESNDELPPFDQVDGSYTSDHVMPPYPQLVEEYSYTELPENMYL